MVQFKVPMFKDNTDNHKSYCIPGVIACVCLTPLSIILQFY